MSVNYDLVEVFTPYLSGTLFLSEYFKNELTLVITPSMHMGRQGENTSVNDIWNTIIWKYIETLLRFMCHEVLIHVPYSTRTADS